MITPPEFTHPNLFPASFKLIADIKSPFDPDRDCLFYKYENILVTFVGGNWQDPDTNEVEYLSYQACFPLAVLPWVIRMLDYFDTPPNEGGLPAGKISNKEEIDGELLLFTRGVCVGGPDHGGYNLENLSRINYGRKPTSNSYQGFDFPDPWLYDGGLLEFWKALANKYENGLL
ncbi:hypothetical protein [Psychromonas antarctica]|uniref:hypothetical protein n=1 Tax=Psychromonas antarctica TaxID=67573 RepID=UPI001EE7A28B|nr:hypothetical protein [Psychromonas antarctica]MCG6202816.1 hypothetical protein [Psychromonas antarctica]